MSIARLRSLVFKATALPREQICPRSYDLRNPVAGGLVIGIRRDARTVRDALEGVLMELDFISRAQNGRGLYQIYIELQDNELFLRLWALAQDLKLFPHPTTAFIIAFDEASTGHEPTH